MWIVLLHISDIPVSSLSFSVIFHQFLSSGKNLQKVTAHLFSTSRGIIHACSTHIVCALQAAIIKQSITNHTILHLHKFFLLSKFWQNNKPRYLCFNWRWEYLLERSQNNSFRWNFGSRPCYFTRILEWTLCSVVGHCRNVLTVNMVYRMVLSVLVMLEHVHEVVFI